jgi:hypothetical protein
MYFELNSSKYYNIFLLVLIPGFLKENGKWLKNCTKTQKKLAVIGSIEWSIILHW